VYIIHRKEHLAKLRPSSKLRGWKDALMIVQPATLLRWHRDVFRFVWRRKSKAESKPDRPPLSDDDIARIKRLARENATWAENGAFLPLHELISAVETTFDTRSPLFIAVRRDRWIFGKDTVIFDLVLLMVNPRNTSPKYLIEG
jgi:hypothetical protein